MTIASEHCPVYKIPVPSIKVDALSDWLYEAGYRYSESLAILKLVAVKGTLEDAVACGHLDHADYPASELIFECDQLEVPYNDPAWDDDATWELGPPPTPAPPREGEAPSEPHQSVAPTRSAGETIDWKNWLQYTGRSTDSPIPQKPKTAPIPAGDPLEPTYLIPW